MIDIEVVESRLADLGKNLESIYLGKTSRSREMFLKASRYFPGGVTYAIRFMHPYPIYIEKALGTKVWDVDGNEYIDFWMGHGAHILGHAPEVVVDAISEVIKKGTHLGYENRYAVEYAEFLTKIVPGLEIIRFTNSGTEANMYALRLARAYTKRKYVLKIEGGWHGGYDALHTAVTSPYIGPESAGLPEEYTSLTLSVPFNNVEALENILKKFSIAAIVVEPVLGAGGCIEPDDGYLKELRRLSYEYGALLIFDEVITGFRLSLGGAQEYFGVKADIVVFGKAIGGGFPGAGAFGGRSEVMELLDHLKYLEPRKRPFHGGTFVGNPVNMVAGYSLIKYLYEHRYLYEKANSLWSIFKNDVEKICQEYRIPCSCTGVGTILCIHFTKIRPRNAREAQEYRWSRTIEKVFHLYARVNNILYLPEYQVHLLPSLIHTVDDSKQFLKIFDSFLHMLLKKS